MITLSAFAMASTVSSTVVFVIVPLISWPGVCATGAMPPNKTFVRDRFIATHYTRLDISIVSSLTRRE
jgi:hypothetical protein